MIKTIQCSHEKTPTVSKSNYCPNEDGCMASLLLTKALGMNPQFQSWTACGLLLLTLLTGIVACHPSQPPDFFRKGLGSGQP
jgi:hypothetical protein